MKLVQETKCEGCEQDIAIYQMPIIGGPNKGKLQEFVYGCKCEEYKMANEAKAAQKRAKLRGLQQMFSRYSLLSPELEQATFNAYKPRNYSQGLAYKSAVKYVQIFSKQKPFNLIFSGEVGVGKSHLAKCIADGIMAKEPTKQERQNGKHGYTAIFISVPKLMRKIRSSYQRDSQYSEEDIFNVLEKVDLLVLDDLGVEKQSDWATERLYDLIDTRQGLHTIFTTNYETADLMELKGGRDFSRIFGNGNDEKAILKMDGDNYRLRNLKGV